jgi:hypothetical protein
MHKPSTDRIETRHGEQVDTDAIEMLKGANKWYICRWLAFFVITRPTVLTLKHN